MAGTRQQNTFVEFLQAMLVDIAKAKLIPDADLDFLQMTEQAVIDKAKGAFLGQPGAPGGGGAPAGPTPPAGLEALLGGVGAPPPGGAIPVTPGGPPAGVTPLPPQPPTEQLERLMRGTA